MEESKKSRGIKEFDVVNNHNVVNLYFTANKSTMYTSYYGKLYELLWQIFHLFAYFVTFFYSPWGKFDCISRCTWKPPQHCYIMLTVMAPFMRVPFMLVFHQC